MNNRELFTSVTSVTTPGTVLSIGELSLPLQREKINFNIGTSCPPTGDAGESPVDRHNPQSAMPVCATRCLQSSGDVTGENRGHARTAASTAGVTDLPAAPATSPTPPPTEPPSITRGALGVDAPAIDSMTLVRAAGGLPVRVGVSWWTVVPRSPDVASPPDAHSDADVDLAPTDRCIARRRGRGAVRIPIDAEPVSARCEKCGLFSCACGRILCDRCGKSTGSLLQSRCMPCSIRELASRNTEPQDIQDVSSNRTTARAALDATPSLDRSERSPTS